MVFSGSFLVDLYNVIYYAVRHGTSVSSFFQFSFLIVSVM